MPAHIYTKSYKEIRQIHLEKKTRWRSIYISDRARAREHTVQLHAANLKCIFKLSALRPLLATLSDVTLRRKVFNWFDIEVEIETMPLNRDNDGIIFDHSF